MTKVAKLTGVAKPLFVAWWGGGEESCEAAVFFNKEALDGFVDDTELSSENTFVLDIPGDTTYRISSDPRLEEV